MSLPLSLAISNKPVAWVAVGLSYLVLVRCLRWRRYNAVHAKYHRRDVKDLTLEEAQKIMQESVFWDMPLLLNYALAFALFKTYGIPSISKLLASTKELKSQDTVSRRYADTEILIASMTTCPINGLSDKKEPDPRAMLALARMNWLHSKYKISNEDFLYTLCLFILEPATWAKRYGWRSLSPLEEQAFFVLWLDIGQKMGIKDIPDTLEGMKEWSQAYEKEYMVPAKTNEEVAYATIEELLYPVPKVLKGFCRGLSFCLLEDRVRTAMLMPAQPAYKHAIITATMHSVSFFQKHFMLPRWSPKSPVDFHLPNVSKGESVRMHPNHFTAKPWYKPESSGLGYLLDRLTVLFGLHTEMPGPHLKSEGYLFHEVGPAKFENEGHEDVFRMAEQLQGCPVPEAWRKGL
ncbi:hypothetical protein AMATHDRAFT_5718 [Amanita thiersii Skay4041]|uniref:ER-bound oxygenase mpaB/mpaB'/Rubber oxygenase catalytic domain-containing protein n=1 Tax=Amanita thiersii Skay4041 TaxID=703135 RepID=A0A2A9ND20_9AGAR|nr:hypothetical protein AMATHDRAFT_5718 [Amanita thiersii Skay4041]